MFEDQTFEAILTRMLDRVPNNIDKREGSVIYNTLAPVAAEFSQVYVDLDVILRLSRARTSSGEFLDMIVEESGIQRRPATKAIRKGVFDVPVPIGSRFRGGNVVYTVIEQIAGNEYRLEAETAGAIGNEYFGSLLPIDYIDGLTSAELTDVLIPGEEAETDEELYARYVEEINATSYGGNVDQYKEWISAIPGVGRFRVQPLWQGRGTVRAIITDANNQVPNQELVDLVQETIDPYQDGKGFGLVPIGHVFTAVGATPKIVNVTVTVEFNTGYGPHDIQTKVEEIIDNYFSEINFLETTLRQAVLISRILDLPEVKDVPQLLLNGVDGNIELTEEEVAQRGTVVVNAA